MYTHIKKQFTKPLIATAATLALSAAPLAAHAAQTRKMPDNRISNAIEDELSTAKMVSANEIDVRVNDGVATLSGTVQTILAKDRAVRITGMIRGVRSIVDRISVDPVERSDTKIRADIVAALATDPATDSWEIGVTVNDGLASLSGTVESFAESELATTIAKSIAGVREVQNNISYTFSTTRVDSEILKDINQRLRWDARIDEGLVSVEVDQGIVTLDGSVGSVYERDLVINDAWVFGVNDVEADSLEVAWWARDQMERAKSELSLSNLDIRNAVIDAMRYDPRVMAFQPDVTVESGVVTLTGIVDNLKAKRAAAQNAANTYGVRYVKNFLKVRPIKERSEQQIRSDIIAAFERDILIDRDDISVVIDGSEVKLLGDVDSYFDRSHAEDIAVRTPGVTNVENNLDVDYKWWNGVTFYDWDPVLYDYDWDNYNSSRLADVEIRKEIVSELYWSPFVDSDQVAVSVSDGVATLTGTVDSWDEYDAAVENAQEGGARRVIKDTLKVDLDG